jgi:hypothetical protein
MMPIAESTIRMANMPGMSRSKLRWSMRKPRPALEPTNSPTMAPITLSSADKLMPTKMKGSAFGRFSFQNSCQRLAVNATNRSFCSDGVAAMPAIVLASTGKKDISAVSTTLDVRP